MKTATTLQTTIKAMEFYDNYIADTATRISSEWFRAQCADLYSAYYLYNKPSTDTEWGQLTIAADAPDGFELADPMRISVGWSVLQTQRFITEKARRLPMYPTR
jgi:hypothetical protein